MSSRSLEGISYEMCGLMMFSLVLTLVMAGPYAGVDVYMDEIFHIPQAQHFCAGEFHVWDDKITTLPGLYLWSTLVTGMGALGGGECSTAVLRGTSVLLSVLVPALSWRIRTKLFHSSQRESQLATLYSAASVALYPPAFFYYFLYYSDTISLVLVLAVYDAFLISDNHHSYPQTTAVRAPVVTRATAASSGTGSNRIGADASKRAAAVALTARGLLHGLYVLILASAAILARQTNVVWIVFVGASCTVTQYTRSTFDGKGPRNISLGADLVGFCYFLWNYLYEVTMGLLPLVLPCITFVAFVAYNGGLVVGDKENHEVTAHWAMFFHAWAVAAVAYGPISILDALNSGKVSNVATWSSQTWAFAAVLCGTTVYSLMYGVLEHPFLLADNRHYTFYVWRYILSHSHWKLRLCLVPVYCAAVGFLLSALIHAGRTPLWLLTFSLCAALTLIPLPLFEPRYFTTSVALILLHMPAPSTRGGFAALAAAGIANVLLIYVFVYRPFESADGSIARFMF
jgi:alpha-1,2-glucosyltransferase